jgi:hypothetical protein
MLTSVESGNMSVGNNHEICSEGLVHVSTTVGSATGNNYDIVVRVQSRCQPAPEAPHVYR